MVYDGNEQFSSAAGNGSQLRVIPITIQPKTFAGGTGTLAKLTPVAFNTSTNFWQVWAAATNEVSTVTANATQATAGNFTLTIDGETTANIAYNANAAAIQAALEAISNVAPGDVTVVDSGGGIAAGSGVATITWAGAWSGSAPVVTADFTGLTGNVHVLAEATAGVVANESNIIRGFVWKDDVVLVSGSEVLGNVLLEGKVHFDDIPVPAGQTSGDLKTALRSGVRERGLIIQGLDSFR